MAILQDRNVIPLGDRANRKQAIVMIPAKAKADKPGILLLQDVDDSAVVGEHYVWFDHNGVGRVHTSIPTDQDADGTVISGGILLKGIIDLEVSFESGEQTTHTLYFPFAVTINKIRAFVTKALAGTDDGTITAKNNAGTGMTGGVITLALSSAVATEGTASPTANNTIAVDEKLQLTVAKTTAGGRARVTVEYTRIV